MKNGARDILKSMGKVVVVHCGDPRIQGHLKRAIEKVLGYPADRMFRQAYPGATRVLVDDARSETNLQNIGDYFELGAEGVILAHHGTTCHAYGRSQDRQLPDLREAGRMVRDRFDCPVIGLWQENPAVPLIEVVQVWRP